ncbi:hypothetical protein GJ744_010309 [Endocarpon pusillum]|uniref:Uncharacterized protein n=1 Tax=Endocarpon pusillum TaxID=364733 RepID=A0A8H7AEM3_9EURO|nr:hypothetical protein GJ744_010309 [Endocarpon pusillum]
MNELIKNRSQELIKRLTNVILENRNIQQSGPTAVFHFATFETMGLVSAFGDRFVGIGGRLYFDPIASQKPRCDLRNMQQLNCPEDDMKAESGERNRHKKKAQPLHGSVELFSGSIQDISVRSVGLGPHEVSKDTSTSTRSGSTNKRCSFGGVVDVFLLSRHIKPLLFSPSIDSLSNILFQAKSRLRSTVLVLN